MYLCNIAFNRVSCGNMHEISVDEYERSWEQNEELGLNDMDTSSADAAYASTDAGETMQ